MKEEVGHLEKTVEAKLETIDIKFDAVSDRIGSLEKSMCDRFDSINSSIDSRFEGVNARFDRVDAKIESLWQQLPMISEMADLKARLAEVEWRTRE